jgi:hypothetical protein
MPSIIPGYVYSLFAALIVGTILVCSCSQAMVNVKNDALEQQLKNIDQYVATQSLILLSQTTGANQNASVFLDVPAAIGNQRFWIILTNGPEGPLVVSGLGTNVTSSSLYVPVPGHAFAQGSFVSGSGRAVLQCSSQNGEATLKLTSE